MMSRIAASFCDQCRKETKSLPMKFAIAVTGAGRSSLYRWMDNGLIHYRELATKHRLLCLDSIRKVTAIDSRLLAALIENPQLGKRKRAK